MHLFLGHSQLRCAVCVLPPLRGEEGVLWGELKKAGNRAHVRASAMEWAARWGWWERAETKATSL